MKLMRKASPGRHGAKDRLKRSVSPSRSKRSKSPSQVKKDGSPTSSTSTSSSLRCSIDDGLHLPESASNTDKHYAGNELMNGRGLRNRLSNDTVSRALIRGRKKKGRSTPQHYADPYMSLPPPHLPPPSSIFSPSLSSSTIKCLRRVARFIKITTVVLIFPILKAVVCAPILTFRRRIISGVILSFCAFLAIQDFRSKYFGALGHHNSKGGGYGFYLDFLRKDENIRRNRLAHGWDDRHSEHESYIGGRRWYVSRSISQGRQVDRHLAGGDMLRYLYIPIGRYVDEYDVRTYLRMDVAGISNGHTWPVLVGEDTLGSIRKIMKDTYKNKNTKIDAGEIATELSQEWWIEGDNRAEELRCIILVFAYGGACVPTVGKIVSYSLDNLMGEILESQDGKKLWAYFDQPENSVIEGNKDMLFLASSVAGHVTLRKALDKIIGFPKKMDPSDILRNVILADKSSSMLLWKGTNSGLKNNRCGYSCSVSQSCCDIVTEKNARILVVSLSPSSVLESITKHEDTIRHGKSATVSVIAPEILNSPPKLHPKDRIEDRMFANHMVPTWKCDRCLRDARRGSFGKCKKECGGARGRYYHKEMCAKNQRLPKAKIDVKVKVDSPSEKKTAKKTLPRLIPRIIHQTWKGKITAERQPSLIRLQHSWRSTGWDYRYYDNDGIRNFIKEHFPQRIVDAYDALIPGAFKADLFRYLVLMIHGGVYADVDILLEGNLDTLIPPSLGFLAPLDTPGEENDERICLWNGFMASAPGHPFVVRAAERTINHILDRADMFDMEREVCLRGKTGDVEPWKMRVERGLIMSGPCALGISVNEALGQPSLEGYDLGWMPSPGVEGNSLILKLDKNDLGSFRLSDITLDVIIASTDIPDMIQNRPPPEEDEAKKERPVVQHYSQADIGPLVWGTKLVYSDLLVTNETLTFTIERT